MQTLFAARLVISVVLSPFSYHGHRSTTTTAKRPSDESNSHNEIINSVNVKSENVHCHLSSLDYSPPKNTSFPGDPAPTIAQNIVVRHRHSHTRLERALDLDSQTPASRWRKSTVVSEDGAQGRCMGYLSLAACKNKSKKQKAKSKKQMVTKVSDRLVKNRAQKER